MKQTNQVELAEEQVLNFSGTTLDSFTSDGGYFQFKDEKETQKFIAWLKELEEQHKKELAQVQQEAVEREREHTVKWLEEKMYNRPNGYFRNSDQKSGWEKAILKIVSEITNGLPHRSKISLQKRTGVTCETN